MGQSKFQTEKLETVILTDRFELEPIQIQHAPRLYDDLRVEELYTYIPEYPPASREALENRYRRWSKRQSDAGDELWLNYAIRNRQSNSYWGTVQATLSSPAQASIAYFVFPKYWRQGVAKEAGSALLATLFADFGVEKIVAQVDTRNVASYKLLESLGFKRTGTLEAADRFKGVVSDEYLYELERASRK